MKDEREEQLKKNVEISETDIDKEPKLEDEISDVQSLPLPSIKRKIRLFNSEINSETNDSESDRETFEFAHSTPKNEKENVRKNLEFGGREELTLIEEIQEKANRDSDAVEEKLKESNCDDIERKTLSTECMFENSEEANPNIAYKPDLENLPDSDSESNTNAEYSNDSLDSESEPEMTFKLDSEFENSVEITEEVSLENSYELENDQVVELALRRHRFHKVCRKTNTVVRTYKGRTNKKQITFSRKKYWRLIRYKFLEKFSTKQNIADFLFRLTIFGEKLS